MRFNSRISKVISKIFLILFGVGFLVPLIWLLLTSFKGPKEVYTNVMGLPEVWHFDNYVRALTKFGFPRYFLNSIIYTGGSTFLVLLCVTMFTYATARFKFNGSDKLQKLIQFGLVIPGGATLLGIYVLLLKFGLKNTYVGLILVFAASSIPIAAVILYGFFRSLPFSLEEAAALDGAGTLRTFFSIILPMVRPALTTIAVTTSLTVWNEYTLSAMAVDVNSMKSLTVGIQSFMTSRGGDWGGMAAALIVACVPTIIMYLVCNEKIEDAITVNSGIK